MYVRNEKRYYRLFNKPFKVGDVVRLTKAQVKQVQHLIDDGSFSLHSTNPNKPKKTAKKKTSDSE